MISDSLYERLSKLHKRALLNVMLTALDEMQGYNGQSMTNAIMRAINAKEVEEGKWFVPTIYQLNKEFKDNCPLF